MVSLNIYQLARKIHRLLVMAILVVSIIMSLTGFFLKFSDLATKFSFDLGLIRYLHNQMSLVFSVLLLLMGLSGLVLYLYPILRKNH